MDRTFAAHSENRDLTPAEIELLASLVIDEPDHYTVLGVERSAPISEINTAYCLAVDFFHPLKHSYLSKADNVLHWKLSSAYMRIVEAFSTLSNRTRREGYDGTLNRQIVGWVRSRERALSTSHSKQVSSLDLEEGSTATPQLLPTGHERRRVKRVPLHLPLVVAFDHHWQETTETIDVSPLGVKFVLSRGVEPGTLVRLELPMPAELRTTGDDNVLYAVSGYVIQVNPLSGKSIVVTEFI
jgi:hypothetical protein